MAEKKSNRGIKTLDELVEYLFTNGSKQKGQRLILVEEDYSGSAQVTKARNLGGWSRAAIKDVIKDFMERQ